MKIDIKKAEDVFKILRLEENSVYKVRVKHQETNPEHEAILFTGFKNGSYCEVYHNSYETPVPMMKVFSLDVLRKLTTLKH